MDDIVTARLPQEIKKQGNEIFARKGTTPSQAINDLYAYVVVTGEMPSLKPVRVEADAKTPRTITAQMREKLTAIKAATSLGIDWGSDAGKPYKQLIEEGRRQDYETLA